MTDNMSVRDRAVEVLEEHHELRDGMVVGCTCGWIWQWPGDGPYLPDVHRADALAAAGLLVWEPARHEATS